MPLTSEPVDFSITVLGEAGPTSLRVRTSRFSDVVDWTKNWLLLLPEAESRWPWSTHISRAEAEDGFACLTVESQLGVEALMSLSLDESKLEVSKRLVYVEYLGVAPWNQGATRRFKRLGSILLETAAGLCSELTGESRIGLHSKDQALPFYRRLTWLRELGPHVTDDGTWIYFEGVLPESP